MRNPLRSGLAALLALVLLLAACGQPQTPAVEGQVQLSVSIDGSQLAPRLASESLDPMGSPIATDGAAATNSVEVRVSDKNGTPVTFDLVGTTYTVAAGSSGAYATIPLTAATPSASVALLASGNPYTFEAHGYHEPAGPVIAYDSQEKMVADDANVQLWLTSVLGGARLVPRYPAAFVTPGTEGFDLLLVVTANGYGDLASTDYLEVPTGDYEVDYGAVSGATVTSSSKRGMRLTIDDACVSGMAVAEGEVLGLVWDGTSVVEGSVQLPAFAIECPSASGGVRADVVSPEVTLSFDGATLQATGTANDPNGLISSVEIWDGPVLVAATDAPVGVAPIVFDLGSTTFRATLAAAPAGGLVAVAFDAAGNEGRSDETFSSYAVWVVAGGTGDGSYANPLGSVQAGIHAVAPGGTVWVGPGTYNENVTVTKSLKLLSTDGRAVTTLQGSDSGGGTATLTVADGVNQVQIGDLGHGLHIVGIEGPAASERAAVYFRGSHSDVVVRGNDIEADGDLGLLTISRPAGQGVVGLEISHNLFTGQTFRGPYAEEGKWTNPNHPRALVALNPGTENVAFVNNVLSGVVGGYDANGVPTSSALAIVSSDNTLISGNEFVSAGLPDNAMHLWVSSFDIDDALLSANSFDRGALLSWPSVDVLYVSLPQELSTAGQTVQVLPGEYHLSEPVLVSAEGVTVRGPNTGVAAGGARGPEATVYGSFHLNAADVTVAGLAFEQFGTVLSEHTPIYLGADAQGVTIASNVVQGAGQAGRGVVSGIGATTSAHIVGNTFRGLGTGTYANPGASFTVEGNVFEDNLAGSANDSPNGVVRNNTFTGNAEGVGLGAAGVTVEGNTFTAAVDAYIVDYVSGYDLTSFIATNTYDTAPEVGGYQTTWPPFSVMPALVPGD